MPFQTCMTLFLLWNKKKEDIFKKVSNDTVLVPLDFHCMDTNTVEGSGKWNCLVISILQNIVFHRRKQVMQVCNDMVVCKWWQDFQFLGGLSL